MTARIGRPPIDGTKKGPQVVYLTAEHVAIAKRLGKAATGDENISAGVRAALEVAAESAP